MENKELRVKELIALRGHYFSAVLLVSSGIAGVFFTNLTPLKIALILIGGGFLDIVFLDKFFKIDDEIKKETGRIE